MTPAVSVIVTAYNVAPFIAETLDSVFAQTFTDFEVIVVNDGSPDSEALEAALAPYASRIRYFRQHNRGASAARNRGILEARAPIVAMLDGDDLWQPEYLRLVAGALIADQRLALSYSNARFFGEGPLVGLECMALSPVEGEVTFERVVSMTCSVIGFVSARKDALVEAGLYDESMARSEDFDLWVRVLKRGGRATYRREVLAGYRRRLGSLSADPITMYRSALKAYDKLARRTDLTPSERRAVLAQRARFFADLRLAEGKRAFFARDVHGAIEGLSDANTVHRSAKLSAAIFLLRLAPGLLRRAYELRDRLVFGTSTRA
jgi:glycosyltransferase involved in cell wall biosynthesis